MLGYCGLREMASASVNPFPKLKNPKITSPDTAQYNCIAWVFGDNTKNWWPGSKFYFWPYESAGKTSLEAFEEFFSKEKWEETENHKLEIGFQKVALYALNGKPTHAARQIADNVWTSKLGQNVDISHKLNELDGPEYGTVLKVYKKLS